MTISRAYQLSPRVLWVLVIAALSSCHGSPELGGPGGGNPRADAAAGGDEQAGEGPVIEPSNPTITVTIGQDPPVLALAASFNGEQIRGSWRLSGGENLAQIDQSSGVVTPTGVAGGAVQVSVSTADGTATTTVTIRLEGEQNGAPPDAAEDGIGGWGGVGGEGAGTAVSEQDKALLDGVPAADATLKLLYPYDKTVWPLGLLPPLLQWSMEGAQAATAIKVELAGDYLHYRGYFSRPAALAADKPFVRHPLLKQIWRQATHACAGGTLNLSLVVLSGGKAYGPAKQQWKIASGTLKGTIYYQAYATQTVKNYQPQPHEQATYNEMIGAATLAIKGGSIQPEVVAGWTSEQKVGCRVCHTVSAHGDRMVVQHGLDYAVSSTVGLRDGYREQPYAEIPTAENQSFGWVGLSADGKLGLTHGVTGDGAWGAINGQSPVTFGRTALFDMDSGTEIATSGLSSFVTKAAFPAFSPQGDHVAFTLFEGPGTAQTGAGDGTQLVSMDFDGRSVFSHPKLLYRASGDYRPGWVGFLPTDAGVVFSVHSKSSNMGPGVRTRGGARGILWWADLASGRSYPLHQANGTYDSGESYLPRRSNEHENDETLNYEPTVAPVTSGGYQWMVFTSRRLYGNVATIEPFASDPRFADLKRNVSPKKLWVAAIDIATESGRDPSHPAFYLPGQELMATNNRGFWALDPPKENGESCESGDECESGYCRPLDPDSSDLTCGWKTTGDGAGPVCSLEYERCDDEHDCCDLESEFQLLDCINGRCSRRQRLH